MYLLRAGKNEAEEAMEFRDGICMRALLDITIRPGSLLTIEILFTFRAGLVPSMWMQRISCLYNKEAV